MAILALPAVAGKFGVRGGGYAMSNSSAWGIERTWIRDQEPADAAREHEPAGTSPHRVHRSAGQGAVRLQLERGRHLAAPDQGPAGARARGSLHGGLRADAHRHGALRRRAAAGDDVPRGLRPGARLRIDQPAPRHAGGGAGRRVAAERRRVRRAVDAPGAGGRRAERRARRDARRPRRVCRSRPARRCGSRAPPRPLRRPAHPVRGRVPSHARPEGGPVPRGARSERAGRDSTAISRTRRQRSSR